MINTIKYISNQTSLFIKLVTYADALFISILFRLIMKELFGGIIISIGNGFSLPSTLKLVKYKVRVSLYVYLVLFR